MIRLFSEYVEKNRESVSEESCYTSSVYTNSTQVRQNKQQRQHHQASLKNNVIQAVCIASSVAMQVPSVQPFCRLEEEVKKKNVTAESHSLNTVEDLKPIFQPDLINNSNNSLYSDVDEEIPDEKQNFKMVGMVTRKNDKGLTIFVPLSDVLKVWAPRNHISNFDKVQPGDWYRMVAQQRREREQDEDNPPLFSHIVVKAIKTVNIYEAFSKWKQRNHAGVFEFCVTTKVDSNPTNYIPSIHSYLVKTEFDSIQVLIPAKRLNNILGMNNTKVRTFEFWATLSEIIDVKPYGYCGLHLLDCHSIFEILEDGLRRDWGIGRSDFVRLEEQQSDEEQDINEELAEASVKKEVIEAIKSLFGEHILPVVRTENLQADLMVVFKYLQKLEKPCKKKISMGKI